MEQGFNGAGRGERVKRVKRIEWVSLVVDVAIMSVTISRTSSLESCKRLLEQKKANC